MAYYLCQFFDESNALTSEIPIVGSSEGNALKVAQRLFHDRGLPGHFELWFDNRRVARISPGLYEAQRSARAGR